MVISELSVFFSVASLFALIVLARRRATQKPVLLLVFFLFAVCILVSAFLYKFTLSHEFREAKSVMAPRIFCIIITAPSNFKSNQPMTVLNVWARKCDNYRFVTIIPNNTKHAFNRRFKSHEIGEPLNIMQPHGWINESYDNLTFKVLSAFRQVYEEFSHYEWYLKG